MYFWDVRGEINAIDEELVLKGKRCLQWTKSDESTDDWMSQSVGCRMHPVQHQVSSELSLLHDIDIMNVWIGLQQLVVCTICLIEVTSLFPKHVNLVSSSQLKRRQKSEPGHPSANTWGSTFDWCYIASLLHNLSMQVPLEQCEYRLECTLGMQHSSWSIDI